MGSTFQLPEDTRLGELLKANGRSAERALKNFRYVVASVNNDALKVWADLWKELRECTTPEGIVLPQTKNGFTPPCGWAEFLEKFWLLKHYLDSTSRFCEAASST